MLSGAEGPLRNQKLIENSAAGGHIYFQDDNNAKLYLDSCYKACYPCASLNHSKVLFLKQRICETETNYTVEMSLEFS